MTSAAKASALYEKYGERVYAFCFGRLGNRDEAADAVQDTFFKAWLALAKGGEIERPLPWLLTIAENVCVSRFRARRSRVTETKLADAEAVRAAQPDVAIDDLAAALRALPDNQRRAFLRREVQGYSYDEIGADLGVSRAAVTALLYRARRALADFLGGATRRAAPCFVPIPELLRSMLQTASSASAAGTAVVVLAIPQIAPLSSPVSSPPDAPRAPIRAADVASVLATAATSVSSRRRAVPGRGGNTSASAPKTSPSNIVSFPSATQDDDLPDETRAYDTTVPTRGDSPLPAGPQLPFELAPPGSDPSDSPGGQKPSEQPVPPSNAPPEEEDPPGHEPFDDPVDPPTGPQQPGSHGKGPSEQPGSQGNGPPEQPGSQGNGPPKDASSQGNGPPDQPPNEPGPPGQPGSQGHGPAAAPTSPDPGPPDHAAENNQP